MDLPDWTKIEILESSTPRFHSGKAAQPDKLIRISTTAELAKNLHTVLFLSFQKMALKQRNEFVTPTWLERILTQLDDATERGIGVFRRVSHTYFPIAAGIYL